MKQYTIKRLDVPKDMELVELTHQPWLTPCSVKARAGLMLCGDRLYVHMEANEEQIRAELASPTDPVCNDSCLEFFLAPCTDDNRYLNFEWNPLGTLYFGFGAERGNRVRQLVDDKCALFCPAITFADGGWGIDFSIPEALIAMYWPDFTFGQPMQGNFYKCGDMTAIPHYLAWAPLSSDHPDFHRRQDFGLFTIGS